MDDGLAKRLLQTIQPDRAADVARRLTSYGVPVTYQAVHKWLRGGKISDENLRALAQVYGVTESWLRYGEGLKTKAPSSLHNVVEVIAALGAEDRQQALGYLEFLISKQGMPGEMLANYLAMIDKIKRDMDGKKR